jgi:pimeloyl-ACP methyl ester carboxylesterase
MIGKMSSILLCLHGWGGSSESFTELREALKASDLVVLTPDLPGFGGNPEPPRAWTTDDYADWVALWVRDELARRNVHVDRFFLLGHSHGGRIAMKLATEPHESVPAIDRLFLCASAGIKHPRHLKRAFGLTLAKTGKFFLAIPFLNRLAPLAKKLLYKLVRVHDYERASPLMRQTLINVTQEDLRGLLEDIKVPTDIFWGENDGMTPVSDGRLMHDRIAGSTLTVFPGVRHGVHRDSAVQIAQRILERASAPSS